jgi:hypothetical protein
VFVPVNRYQPQDKRPSPDTNPTAQFFVLKDCFSHTLLSSCFHHPLPVFQTYSNNRILHSFHQSQFDALHRESIALARIDWNSDRTKEPLRLTSQLTNPPPISAHSHPLQLHHLRRSKFTRSREIQSADLSTIKVRFFLRDLPQLTRSIWGGAHAEQTDNG